MRLFDNPLSPFALKVRVVLYEKGIDFEPHEITHRAQRGELLRVNPRGEVPALEDGDTMLYDSKVICEYLEERHPSPPLLPSVPAARARCRAVELIADTQLDACLYLLGLVELFRPDVKTRVPELAARVTELLRAHHAALERALGGGSHFAGDFSRADVAVFPHLAFAAFMGHPVGPSQPALAAWMARLNERPSVQRATADAMRAFEASQSDPDPFFTSRRLHWRSDRIEWALRLGLGPWLLEELAGDRAFFSPGP